MDGPSAPHVALGRGDQRLTGITNAATGVSPGPRSYTFGYGTAADGGGPQNPYDIMNSTQTAGGGASWASQNWSYAYDNDDRLTSAVGSVIGTYSYAYDAAGNTTTFTTNNPPSSTSPTFNSLNEMASNGSLTPTYDSNGNSTSQGRSHQSYTFDAENRILSLTIPPHFPISWTESFQYDGLGRRLISGFAIGGSPTYTHWLWMGGRLLEQRNSSDTVEKLYYPEGEYYQQTGKKAAYFPDQIGSVRDTDDVAGTALLYSADYTPYGLQTPGWTASGNYFPDIRFAGMFTESNSAELLTPARLYEAAEGRFMGRDPLGYTPGPNLYAYANGNPISTVDPSGLCPPCLEGAGLVAEAVAPETCEAVAGAATRLFTNQLPRMLATETEAASAAGATIGEATTGLLEQLASEGTGTIKFVVTQDGKLIVAPQVVGDVEISHSVLSGGEAVLTAGEADIAAGGGELVGVRIEPYSGHFEPTPESLPLATEAFRKLGVTFP